MSRPDHRNQIGWRRVVGWFAAYLLVFHVIVAGALSGHSLAEAVAPSVGQVFCLTGAEHAPSPADLPAHTQQGKIHCAICASGGFIAPLAAASPVAPPMLPTFAPATLREEPHAQSCGAQHRSRAPPLT